MWLWRVSSLVSCCLQTRKPGKWVVSVWTFDPHFSFVPLWNCHSNQPSSSSCNIWARVSQHILMRPLFQWTSDKRLNLSQKIDYLWFVSRHDGTGYVSVSMVYFLEFWSGNWKQFVCAPFLCWINKPRMIWLIRCKSRSFRWILKS